MAKIMLVEDDNNLREIYEARLLAEGYEIVAAKDGEEALALAVKERPDLIISDVMMPKISGFDMLDILRSTAETKDTKVIMMTALSQAEDKTRADKLGADRYLVKSQVTLEDVAKVARDVLAGTDSSAAPAEPATAAPAEPAATIPVTEPTVTPVVPAEPPTDTSVPATEPVQTVVEPIQPAEPAIVMPDPISPVAEEQSNAPDPIPAPTEPSEPEPIPAPAPDPAPGTSQTAPEPTVPSTPEAPATLGEIKSDLTQTTAQEEQAIENQINEIFAEPAPEESNMVTTPAPGEAVAPQPPSVSPYAAADEQSAAPLDTQPIKTIEVTDAPAEPTVPEVSTPPEPAAQDIPEIIAPSAPAPAPEAPAAEPTADSSSVPIGGKKVIQPINDLSKGPDINQLLDEEAANEAVPPPPATSVVSPGGQTVVPVTTDTPTDTKQPGNVISPNDIAL